MRRRVGKSGSDRRVDDQAGNNHKGDEPEEMYLFIRCLARGRTRDTRAFEDSNYFRGIETGVKWSGGLKMWGRMAQETTRSYYENG